MRQRDIEIKIVKRVIENKSAGKEDDKKKR